ncbi:tyrosine-type recombinase/integrase [Novosphingobium bradum]|uniref:Tyrosine-type recombinase/integrase n=1 Tax=Novosphingobium bradum TaxID=1737444 RepID=A0ABV7IRV8_9SPHN
MPRKLHNALNPIMVKNAGIGRHADGGGLYLRVQAGGARSWLFRSTIGGKARDVGIGPAAGPNAIPLTKARDMVRALAAQAAQGEMIEGKRTVARKVAAKVQAAALAAKPFREVAEAFIDLREDSWRNGKHRAQWRATLVAYAYPVFGDLPVSQIETAHVMEALEPIWKAKPETASRVRGRIENILDAAKVQGLRSGENPARWRGHLDHLLPKRARHTRGNHAALPYADLPGFMADLRGRDAVAARALEFTILTAARSGEVLGATWGEIDLEAALWTIPAGRMKAGKEHRVPLSPRAMALVEIAKGLRTRAEPDAPVFPSAKGKTLSGMAMAMLLRRMKLEAITVHGFRSTFRDWAAERTGFSHEVCEMALAHVIGNKAEAAYRRGDLFDKRRKLMEAWAAYAASPVAAGGNVKPIRAKAG